MINYKRAMTFDVIGIIDSDHIDVFINHCIKPI